MIRLENVSVGHGGRPVLEDVNFRVARGEAVGLLGPNGSGKTTLLLTLAGAMHLLSGSVTLAGKPLGSLRPRERARLAASVPQQAAPPELRVLSVALMGRYAHNSFLGGYSQEDRAKAHQALEDTGCGHLAQRRAETAELLLKRNAAGLTMLPAIHDLNLAALTCRRLLFLKNGRLALDGAVAEVFTEEHLSEIYETRILVSRHPLLDAPQAHLAPGAPAAPAGGSGPGRTG